MLKVSTAPHISSSTTTQSIMRDVIIALIPAIIVAVVLFGLGAVIVLLTSIAGCVLCEYLICRYFLKIPSTTNDYSAIITGILLAFNLPSNIPVWMILTGCIFAIGISKMAFGGIGKNLFNPALAGRVFLFISFPVQMSLWPIPNPKDFANIDIQTSATTLGIIKNNGDINAIPDYYTLFIGNHGGCIGEVSVLALLIGLIYLLYRRIISLRIPFYYIATVFILTSIPWLITKNISFDPLLHLLSGGLILGAVFMATDYTTSPMSKKGQIIFAIGCGALTVVIRLFGAYPEGVSFAILVMNAFTPLIDKLSAPRVFGKGKIK